MANDSPVDNKVLILVLQHPQEQDHALGTAHLLVGMLADARIAVGLSWRNLGHALGKPADARNWGVLYLGSAQARARAEAGGSLIALDRKGEPLVDQHAARVGLEGLVALDGSWAQAKALWWRNPWLTRLRRFVVVPDGPSLYGDVRREARPEAVSTLEAVAFALSVLEGDAAIREQLAAPLRALVARARSVGTRNTKRDRRRLRRP